MPSHPFASLSSSCASCVSFAACALVASCGHGDARPGARPDPECASCRRPDAACSAGPCATPSAATFTAAGGRLSRLSFAVVGDTRPADVDDTAAYPEAVVASLFADVQSLDPAPPFAVSTGDYVFASREGGQAAPQLDAYLRARAAFAGVLFPAMGNHECTGATASNCGPGNADGTPDNYTQFLARLLGPLGRTKPYYAVPLAATDASWTAKLVFVAANAWDDAQAAWLEETLARPSTYTFVVRHEPASAASAPGVAPSEQILARHPYTLLLAGHTHTCARTGPREVVFGNGGAPLASGARGYGFGVVERRADGAVQVDAFDRATKQRDEAFSFAVAPDGAPALP